MQLLII